jgi:hypothetical protein
LNTFSYRWRLWKLQRELGSLSRRLDHEYADAKRSGATTDKLSEIVADGRVDTDFVEDEIRNLESQYLREEAQRLLLSVPTFAPENKGGLWKESTVSGRFYLNSEGIAQLRAATRKEKREKREAAVVWLAAITGAIGALTGLVSTIMKR